MKNKDKILGIFLVGLGTFYILNFGFGVIELIPDNIALIGNLDEGGAGALVLYGLNLIRGKK